MLFLKNVVITSGIRISRDRKYEIRNRFDTE